jgi:putative membrane protein
MSTATGTNPVKEHVTAVTALLTIAGYGLVAATFGGLLPIYPDIGESGVNMLGHAIAVVNTMATITLALGWRAIRRGDVTKHRNYMVTSFVLILLFLLFYLPKVGGGGEKEFVLTASYAFVPTWDWIYPAYLAMLAIHILLSILAMPVVLYALMLGATHSPTELTDTPHRKVGRIAAGSWILSLVLGVLTYLLLNHLYAYEFAAV